MKKYSKVLSECPLFTGIDSDSLVRMLSCLGARVIDFDKKYTIIAEGSKAKYVGIMLSGSARIEQTDYYGNRSILGNISRSQMFGEAFACAEVSAVPVTVIANEPCEVMFVDCSHILHTCANGCGFHHQLIFNLMRELASKNIAFHKRLEITSKRSTREKLMTYLLACAKSAGKDSFVIPFDRQQLADYLEVDRSGLSAEISKLRREGIIESNKKHFRLL